ncbi:hypothetical protein C8J56DRAFT_903873 [Mycena floridula]|nr:hypothetical protein C8J56DRAFT_903873 [Mycena floridula]
MSRDMPRIGVQPQYGWRSLGDSEIFMSNGNEVADRRRSWWRKPNEESRQGMTCTLRHIRSIKHGPTGIWSDQEVADSELVGPPIGHQLYLFAAPDPCWTYDYQAELSIGFTAYCPTPYPTQDLMSSCLMSSRLSPAKSLLPASPRKCRANPSLLPFHSAEPRPNNVSEDTESLAGGSRMITPRRPMMAGVKRQGRLDTKRDGTAKIKICGRSIVVNAIISSWVTSRRGPELHR